MQYTNQYTGQQHNVASCGSCGTPAPKPCNTCPQCPVLCAETCVQPTCGVSQPNVGLQERYIIGLGNEDRVNTNGLIANTGFNYIPWYWQDPSILDPTASFTPKRYNRCDGKYFEAPDRNTYVFKNANGTIIKTWINPYSTLNTLAGITLKLTDTNPFLNQEVLVLAGNPIEVSAGTGIDIIPLASGFRIVNTSVIEPTVIQRVSTSGLTLTGSGTSINPFLIGIDCGTLSRNCGLVKSVNGIVPDENGNVVSSGGSAGISSILPDAANIISFTPTSSGILQTNFSCSNLKVSCNLLDTSSFIPLSRIAQSNATIGQIPVFNGINWVASTPAGGSTTVQYQEDGANTGTTNPTVINFTGSGAVATQSGGVVTVNIPGGVSTLGQGFQGTYLVSANISAVQLISIPDNIFGFRQESVFSSSLRTDLNTAPSLFSVSGTRLTINQSGDYLVIVTSRGRIATTSSNIPVYPITFRASMVMPILPSQIPPGIGSPRFGSFPQMSNQDLLLTSLVQIVPSYTTTYVVSAVAGQFIDEFQWSISKESGYTSNSPIRLINAEAEIGIYRIK